VYIDSAEKIKSRVLSPRMSSRYQQSFLKNLVGVYETKINTDDTTSKILGWVIRKG
jgi:hypothetical protein